MGLIKRAASGLFTPVRLVAGVLYEWGPTVTVIVCYALVS